MVTELIPRLTIVMPAYNAAEYIGEAVESILNQTFLDFQLWIIDDGSTDGTRQVIERLSDIRIYKIYHNENRGREAVVNEVVKKIRTQRYETNPSLIYKQAATYYLYWKMESEASKNMIIALKLKPFHFRNFFLLAFILVMIGRNGILKMGRPHYQTYFNTHN